MLTQWNDLREALRFDGANKAFRVRIQIRTARGQLHGLNVRGFQQRGERFGKERIAIMDEVAAAVDRAVVGKQ